MAFGQCAWGAKMAFCPEVFLFVGGGGVEGVCGFQSGVCFASSFASAPFSGAVLQQQVQSQQVFGDDFVDQLR